MKIKISWKIISFFLIIAILMTSLPIVALAEEIRSDDDAEHELYIKDVKLVQAKSADEARHLLSISGYAFLDGNLNEGTGKDGIWMGYLTTTDPTEAIYDLKVMNMKGGFTRSSMEQALASQESALAGMARDLEYLVNEFVVAYNEETVAAKSAYNALNFFRVVNGETELAEENGLGYQIVNGGVSHSILTEILLFCEPTFVDCIVKLLTMGIQGTNESWLNRLSEVGPYDEDTEYMDDEDELSYRANQLLNVLQLYSEIYNTMVKSGLMPDELDEDLNPIYKNNDKNGQLTAEEADLQKAEDSRYKFYKLAEIELAKHPYGNGGKTLKDFFVSLANEDDEKELYPLVSVLSDGEFSALSYGCFLEMVTGADATEEDFSSYDDLYATLTEEMSSVYLYAGVDKALFDDEAIVGFTETAQRHIAETGETNFFEKENTDERIWNEGIRIAKCIAAGTMAAVGLTKITVGILIGVAGATATKSAAMAATIKYGAMIGGLKGMIAVAVVVALSLLISYIHALRMSAAEDNIDWEKNPMLQYIYDVQEVSFMQASNDGVATEFMRRPAFILYEAVTDLDGALVDLNARSDDASQWIQLFVSRDKQGTDAKPIMCDTEGSVLRIQTGIGETPEGYVPLTRFGEVIAYNLNQWDEKDAVNGVYVFYKQDQDIAVDSGVTYYISEVQLQTGESPAHCINLLRDAGYMPINVNLSPDLTDGDFLFEDKIYTYIGYKTTTSKANAIRDIRLVYGPSQGTIQYGAVGYAACGSNDKITLYATKYEIAGTPLLAGGLICVDKQSKAPLGYEPVCLMSGGPAVPVNVNNNGEAREDNGFMYLYFLPETTFTSGKQYLGGLAVFQGGVGKYDGYHVGGKEIPVPNVAKDLWGDYVPAAYGKFTWFNAYDRYVGMVAYYPTYNPYRAVYGIKAAEVSDYSNALILDGTSYYAWNRINWGYNWHKDAEDTDADIEDKDTEDKDTEDKDIIKDMILTIRTMGVDEYKGNGAFYLTGNNNKENTYDAINGKMNKVQPLELSDFVIFETNSNPKYTVPDTFYPVVDAFTNDVNYPMHYNDNMTRESFVIYTKTKSEEKPYVSSIMAVDTFTLYRTYGGAENGVALDQITESMRYGYLASQGATDILPFTPHMGMEDRWHNLLGILDYKNVTQFGIQRTAKSDQALRDVFFYFNEFSTDEPPKELYRGSVKYSLLCEVPYNLLGYEDVPKMGVYLYGTTNSKAGERIIDLQLSSSPFMAGYETVRTMNGRSLISEVRDYAKEQAKSNPMGNGREFFEAVADFFDNDDDMAQVEHFYIHIKREKDDSNQRLYIEELYLTNCSNNYAYAIETLFDQGAEEIIRVDLNEGAGGDHIYLGYSYTSDVLKSIREIRAYHEKNPSKTMTDDDGRVFELVKDLDLNKGAGGDYIYLYTSRGIGKDMPIVSISVGHEVVAGSEYRQWESKPGYFITHTTYCTKQWDSSKNSDLNRWAGGEYVYLMYTVVGQNYISEPETVPNYGNDKKYSRKEYANQNPNGKYIGGLYVMDKETIRLEKIEAGALSASSKCKDISDEEVFERLRKMGATTIIETPIMVNSDGYFEGNTNKVFIGYSRTKNSAYAIRNIAIKAEIASMDEPKESLLINGKKHNLVAEAANDVTDLPKAINLIGIEGGHNLQLPRLYLYYSTATGNDPIYDISIDDLPLVNDYNTVRSTNLLDPFTDMYEQACALRDLAEGDQMLLGESRVYTEELAAWMDEIADLFNPEDANAKPFYIHVKKHNETSLEKIKPYIGKIFIAIGESEHEALSKLVAFDPDGFVEVNFNQDAGGNKIYMAYKRVGKAREALTDIVVYEGKKFEPSRRITVDGETVKFTLAADIDLNNGAGGEYLYLYTTDSKNAGNPIMNLDIKEHIDSYLKCGVERVTVRRADGEQYTDEYIDLNKGAGGDYIYMIMTRETTEGHTSNGIVTKKIVEDPTCTEDGCRIEVTACVDCGAKMETVVEVLKAHGNHIDDEEDGDHDCDVCGKRNVTEHIIDGYVAEDSDNPGAYKFVQRCSDCEEPNGVEYPISVMEHNGFGTTQGAASLLGNGSIVAVCFLAGIAILAALIVFTKKRKNENINKGEHEK